jgi:putative ABC transport system ATP-binding protein
MPIPHPIIRLRDVSKTYRRGRHELCVLDRIHLEIAPGSFEALMGPSGSGKSSLLNLIAGLDRACGGSIEVAGTPISALGDGALTRWRARHIAFIYQFHNLLPVLTAFENVELPLRLHRLGRAERRGRVATALRMVGMSDRMDHYPRELSGGQEQRTAIARAIVSDATILVADEPTGDLDRDASIPVLNLLRALNREFGKTIIIATHDPLAARMATVVRYLDKGRPVVASPAAAVAR